MVKTKNQVTESDFQLEFQKMMELSFKLSEKIKINNEKPKMKMET